MVEDMTEFQKEVYAFVRNIPKGKTMTYGEVAKAIGRPKAYRAVGNALNKNKDSAIPCHRVIKRNGDLGGYNRGYEEKYKLLKYEKALPS